LESVWEIPEAKFVVLAASLIGLIAIGIYCALKVRGLVFGSAPSLNEHLDDFQEMVDRGDLAPEEFKRVRASVKEKLREEVSKEIETSREPRESD
jgi:hypothetical protein